MSSKMKMEHSRLQIEHNQLYLSSQPPTDERRHTSNRNDATCANVIFLRTNDYLPCTLVALYSLKFWAKTEVDIILMVSEDVEKQNIQLIEKLFSLQVKYFDYIHNPSKHKTRLNNNYSKLRIWQLTTYQKLIYYDSDFIILRSHDHLCDLPSPFYAVENYNSFKEVFNGQFNGGIMVLAPSDEIFSDLFNFSQGFETKTGGDQAMLNSLWRNWKPLDKFKYATNGNIIDNEIYEGKWNISTLYSFHMTNHLNPCVTTSREPEIFKELVTLYKNKQLRFDHPLSIWFKAKEELIERFPELLSIFSPPSLLSPSTLCSLLSHPSSEIANILRTFNFS